MGCSPSSSQEIIVEHVPEKMLVNEKNEEKNKTNPWELQFSEEQIEYDPWEGSLNKKDVQGCNN